ncbi:hypothetical protein C2W62_40800, partial [Candidatus Entotheonella serta]
HLYKRQKLPLGSGITEAACKIVFTQRFKRSGMSWTINGGQVISDAGGVTRNAQSRSARATRRIGLWAESDYPPTKPQKNSTNRCHL